MDKEKAAYLAGIIDGEGNIGIWKRAPKPLAGEKSPTFLDYVKVSNTDYRLIQWVHATVGMGSIYVETRQQERCRKVFTWHISSKQCFKFLQEIYPYLIIKKEQAELVFRFRKTYDVSYYQGVPAKVINQREIYCAEMVRLHKHVVHGPPIYAKNLKQKVELRLKALRAALGEERYMNLLLSGFASATKARALSKGIRYLATVGGIKIVGDDMPNDGYESRHQASLAAKRFKKLLHE